MLEAEDDDTGPAPDIERIHALYSKNEALLKDVAFDFLQRLDRLMRTLPEQNVVDTMITLLKDEKESIETCYATLATVQDKLHDMMQAESTLLYHEDEMYWTEEDRDKAHEKGDFGKEQESIAYMAELEKRRHDAERIFAISDINQLDEESQSKWETMVSAADRISPYLGDKSFIPSMTKLLLREAITNLTREVQVAFDIEPPSPPVNHL